jgi:hypothetical protein
MDNNLATLSTGQITVSSELAAFPYTNAQNTFRSKIWKPSGRFTLTAANNLLYINDGSPKTITLTAGEYTTPDLLATHITTQLNASSSGWTVAYNYVAGEYRFSFAHASAHTLVLSTRTNSVWDTIGFTSTADETISTRNFASDARVHTSESVLFDLGYNAPITFFSVINPLGETVPFSNSATIKLQANNINLFTAPPLDLTLTVSPGGLFKFLDDITDTGYRFWKFSFIDINSANGPSGFNISYIYLGTFTELSRNISVGFQTQTVDPSTRSESENGALYFDEKVRYDRITNSSIGYLSRADRQTMQQLYFDYGSTTPFFFSIDPDLCISDELYEFTKYVIFDDAPTFQHINSDIFSMNMSFRELL